MPMASDRDWQLLNESAVKCTSLMASNERENILSHMCSTAQCDPSLYIKMYWDVAILNLKIQDFFKQMNLNKILEEFFFQNG